MKQERTNKQIDRQRDKQTYRQTDKQTNRQTDKQTNADKHIHIDTLTDIKTHTLIYIYIGSNPLMYTQVNEKKFTFLDHNPM